MLLPVAAGPLPAVCFRLMWTNRRPSSRGPRQFRPRELHTGCRLLPADVGAAGRQGAGSLGQARRARRQPRVLRLLPAPQPGSLRAHEHPASHRRAQPVAIHESRRGEECPPGSAARDRDRFVRVLAAHPQARRPQSGGPNRSPARSVRTGQRAQWRRPSYPAAECVWRPRRCSASPTACWAEPRTVGRIELAFDTDFDHPMESVLMGHP